MQCENISTNLPRRVGSIIMNYAESPLSGIVVDVVDEVAYVISKPHVHSKVHRRTQLNTRVVMVMPVLSILALIY